MPPRKPADQWLNERIDALLPLTAGLESPAESGFEARSWTWLKLAVLDTYIPTYLGILEPLYDRLVFVDLFAGSGVSLYRDGSLELCAPATSLVAASYLEGKRDPALTGFDEIVAVETNEGRADSLQKALNAKGYEVGRNLTLVRGDANRSAREVAKVLNQSGTHALLFADPEGLDLHYDTLEAIITDHPGTDLFVTHLVAGAARAIAGHPSPKRSAMYGTEAWQGCSSREDYTRLYERQIKALREIVVTITIHGDFDSPSYYYDLIFGVRRTSVGSLWADTIARLRPKVEQLSGTEVARILRTRAASSDGKSRTRQRMLDEHTSVSQPQSGETGPK